jgi:hypothetical protein
LPAGSPSCMVLRMRLYRTTQSAIAVRDASMPRVRALDPFGAPSDADGLARGRAHSERRRGRHSAPSLRAPLGSVVRVGTITYVDVQPDREPRIAMSQSDALFEH